MSDASGYEDIIGLPHHVSRTHPHMAPLDRAAQFSPFAALTGHEAAIAETARRTEERVELDEDRKIVLDEKLQILRAHLTERPKIAITYFKPDEKKEGGAYLTARGSIKKIDEYAGCLVMEDETILPIADLFAIEGEIFGEMEDTY